MMRWYKRHPQKLNIESEELCSNSNYREAWQRKHNIFMSAGEIIVRLDKNYYYPVLFAYPDSTPYVLPTVFLLKSIPDVSTADVLSRCSSIYEVSCKLKNNVEFYYFRHQNSDGSLCLLDADNLGNENAAFYSANQIIERIRYWFECILTNKIPPESPQVEAFAHSPNRVNDTEILYPNIFGDTTIDNGEFYASSVVHIPFGDNYVKRIFWGILLTGRTKGGIECLPLGFQNALHLLPESIKKPVDLIGKNESVKKAIENQRLIIGHWWTISDEPRPFRDINDLALSLCPESKDNGFDILQCAIGKNVVEAQQEIFIGLRFYNRKKEYEWLFLVLRKVSNDVAALIGKISFQEFYSQLLNYNLFAVHSELFDDKQHHLRNSGRIERDEIKKCYISVIGCGALGGEIADSLCKAGVGGLYLVDNQDFRAHNSIRHVVGIENTGLPKTFALREYLKQHNPFVELGISKKCYINILDSDINEYIHQKHIGISTIADDNIEGFLNEQAIVNNKTIFYSRVLRGGKAARIFRVIPGIDACKNCLALYREDEKSSFPNIPEDKMLPTIINECNNPIRPASSADIKNVAGITARIIVEYLLDSNKQINNHWVWTTEKGICQNVDTNNIFSLIPFDFKPHTNCPYCAKKDDLSIHISAPLIRMMKEEISENPSVETGGVLVGYYEGLRIIRVTHVSGPGPNAVKRADIFRRDNKFCQKFLDDVYIESDKKSVYAGEWHYHTTINNQASPIDLFSLNEISKQNEYLVEEPIMIIFSNENKFECTAHPANRSYYKIANITIEEN